MGQPSEMGIGPGASFSIPGAGPVPGIPGIPMGTGIPMRPGIPLGAAPQAIPSRIPAGADQKKIDTGVGRLVGFGVRNRGVGHG